MQVFSVQRPWGEGGAGLTQRVWGGGGGMLEALRTKVLGWRLGLVCAVESLL